MKRFLFTRLFGVLVGTLLLFGAQGASHAQATWEGPTGVFLNPLAFTLGKGQVQASAHWLELDSLGSLSSYGVSYGITPSWDVGVTRAHLAVGAGSDTDVFHTKWVALRPGAKEPWPTVAAGAVIRNAQDGPDTSDYYLAATRVFPTAVPVIVSATARATNGLGSGLFGQASKRTVEFGGVVAVVLAKGKLVLGAEYFEQPGVRAWQDLAFRWNVGPKTYLDGGIANLDKTLDNQVAFALSHQW